jgi:hypothetical protein
MRWVGTLAAPAAIALASLLPGPTIQGDASPPAPVAAGSARPAGQIPPDYLVWYLAAAHTCPGLSWALLAAIGTVESRNGASTAAGVHSGANFAGAEGPMQFRPATFARYAVDVDPLEPLSPYDPGDAIFTAAHMLCERGVRGGSETGIRRAILAYNDADWYVRTVLTTAAGYQQPHCNTRGCC